MIFRSGQTSPQVWLVFKALSYAFLLPYINSLYWYAWPRKRGGLVILSFINIIIHSRFVHFHLHSGVLSGSVVLGSPWRRNKTGSSSRASIRVQCSVILFRCRKQFHRQTYGLTCSLSIWPNLFRCPKP